MKLKEELKRIITHNDFDGLVSAAFVSKALEIDKVLFTGPQVIINSRISISTSDVVCDLPYPLECGLWFDHHPGNLEELKLRKINPEEIQGRFEEQPSCAHVIYNYFTDQGYSFPEFYQETLQETDTIDSFNYSSVEEWRRETPGKLVDLSIKASFKDANSKRKYLYHLVTLIRGYPLENVLEDSTVKENLNRYRREEENMLSIIQQHTSFLPQDKERELIILDFTGMKWNPHIIKNLAYIFHPEALGVIAIYCQFINNRKTNNLNIAFSLSMNLNGKEHSKDVGEIFRRLNLGDGHKGAAAGTLNCSSKAEMLKNKSRILDKIWNIWKSMS